MDTRDIPEADADLREVGRRILAIPRGERTAPKHWVASVVRAVEGGCASTAAIAKSIGLTYDRTKTVVSYAERAHAIHWGAHGWSAGAPPPVEPAVAPEPVRPTPEQDAEWWAKRERDLMSRAAAMVAGR